MCVFHCRDSYQGALSEEEMVALEEAAKEKANALSVIQDREQEIRDIRDGKITANKVSDKVTITLTICELSQLVICFLSFSLSETCCSQRERQRACLARAV